MKRIKSVLSAKPTPLIKSWFELGVLTGIAFLGAVMLLAGLALMTFESAQVRLYNQGRALYEVARHDEMKIDAAILALDQSLDQYNSAEKRSFTASLIYSSRSTEIAALALSKKAVLYLLKGKPELAVQAFKQSISLNSGEIDPDLIAVTMPGEKLSQEDIFRMAAQAQVAIHNLEMLFGKSQSQKQAQGKGQGKGNGNDPEQAPGSKPAPGVGKSGNPDAI